MATTQQLTAIPRDSGGNALTGKVVTFTSSDPTVATVSAGGLITAVGVGSCTVTVACEAITVPVAVTVTQQAAQDTTVASVVVTPSTASVVAGQTVQLSAVAKNAAGQTIPGAPISWSSGTPADATVDGTGLVTGVAAGSSTITASSGGFSDTCAVTVTAAASGGTYADTFAADSITGVADQAEVAAWTNDADNARNAAEIDATHYPVFQQTFQNGKPAVKFNGAAYTAGASGMSFTSQDHPQVTVFAVVRWDGLSDSRFGRILADSANELFISESAGKIVWWSMRSTTNGQWTIPANALVQGVPTIVEVTYDSTNTANAPTIALNGATQTITTTASPVGTQQSGAGTGYLGNHSTAVIPGRQSMNGLIAEVTRFDGVLSAADLTTERQRLATKYGITLA